MKLITNRLPSAGKLSVPERRALWRHLVKGESVNMACEKSGANATRLRKLPAFAACCREFEDGAHLLVLEMEAQTNETKAKANPDPIADLLKEIDARSPQAVLTHAALPAESQSHGVASPSANIENPTQSNQQVTQGEKRPQDDANMSADQRSARLAAALERIEREAEEAAKNRPEVDPANPQYNVPVNPPDPERKAPTMLQIIRAGELTADQERYNLARKIWQENDYRKGVGQFDMAPWMRRATDVEFNDGVVFDHNTGSNDSRARLQHFLASDGE